MCQGHPVTPDFILFSLHLLEILVHEEKEFTGSLLELDIIQVSPHFTALGLKEKK